MGECIQVINAIRVYDLEDSTNAGIYFSDFFAISADFSYFSRSFVKRSDNTLVYMTLAPSFYVEGVDLLPIWRIQILIFPQKKNKNQINYLIDEFKKHRICISFNLFVISN